MYFASEESKLCDINFFRQRIMCLSFTYYGYLNSVDKKLFVTSKTGLYITDVKDITLKCHQNSLVVGKLFPLPISKSR